MSQRSKSVEATRPPGAVYRRSEEELEPLGDSPPPDLEVAAIHGAFCEFVGHPDYVCLGARSVLHQASYHFGVYDALADLGSTRALAAHLEGFTQQGDIDDSFATFVACFREPRVIEELTFERLLWAQLQMLRDEDAPHHGWSEEVEPDPDSPHFGYSFAERAFFIVGLHPSSSRLARRFPWPMIVFNPHEQFERLREQGIYGRMRDKIRERDQQLQGSINPELRDHGQVSEARQYSGRPHSDSWRAPFDPRIEEGERGEDAGDD